MPMNTDMVMDMVEITEVVILKKHNSDTMSLCCYVFFYKS